MSTTFQTPTHITQSDDIKGDSNFPQGCEISPDGLCVLTSTAADNLLRLYNVPHHIVANGGTSNSGNDVSGSNSSSSGGGGQPSPWKTSLIAREGDSIRSYCWYPLMNSYNPSSCAFLAASREQPIHLIDAYTSDIRASYRPYNALDEMESPNVITFTPDGSRIFSAGFRTDRMIQVFDTAIPGRDASILRLGKTRKSKDGQKGICSAISFPGEHNNVFGSVKSNVFAIGTYSPGSIYIYDDRRPSGDTAGTILHGGMCVVGHGSKFTKKKRRFADITSDNGNTTSNTDNGDDEPTFEEEQDIFSMAKVNWYQNRARGGITQLQWSTKSDFYLFSASRRSDSVLMWDMRVLSGSESHPIRGIMSFPRESETNQRLQFDLSDDGSTLFTASQDKTVKIYDTKNGSLKGSINGFDDVVNGVSLKQDINGKDILAVSVGSRRFHHDSLLDVGINEEDTCIAPKNNNYESNLDVPGSLSLFHIENMSA